MLVRRDGLMIGQPAHAWVSGQLARAWGNDAFPAPAPREPLCLAAEQHDVGWADADLAPTLDADGRPRSFMAVPRPAHVAIWRGAARRLLAQSRHAALLVSLHGTSLYDRYVDADAHPPDVAAAIRDYLAGERALQAELARGLDPGVVDRGRRLLLALDRLSLALCHGDPTVLEDVPAAGGESATIRVAPAGGDAEAEADAAARASGDGEAAARAGGDAEAAAAARAGGAVRDDRAVAPGTPTRRFTLDPWPFAAPGVAVGCEARRVGGPFGDDEALRAALAAAPWVPLRWVLSRA